jgi:hypothetical protein
MKPKIPITWKIPVDPEGNTALIEIHGTPDLVEAVECMIEVMSLTLARFKRLEAAKQSEDADHLRETVRESIRPFNASDVRH